MEYYVVDTGYEGDFKRRLGNNYDAFIKRCEKMENLVSIGDYVKKEVSKNIKSTINMHTLGNNCPIFTFIDIGKDLKILEESAISEAAKIAMAKGLETARIEFLIQQARNLDYCHIWADDNSGEISHYNTVNGRITIIKVEAESG